jgi:hypothetical protein
MLQEFNNERAITAEDFQFAVSGDTTGLAAWTEIEAGRFMPRRVRGSFQGRALG